MEPLGGVMDGHFWLPTELAWDGEAMVRGCSALHFVLHSGLQAKNSGCGLFAPGLRAVCLGAGSRAALMRRPRSLAQR
jgi:hypothetical protein